MASNHIPAPTSKVAMKSKEELKFLQDLSHRRQMRVQREKRWGKLARIPHKKLVLSDIECEKVEDLLRLAERLAPRETRPESLLQSSMSPAIMLDHNYRVTNDYHIRQRPIYLGFF